MKIVLNKCYGEFGLSPLAVKRYLELKGKECFFYEKLDLSDLVIKKDLNDLQSNYPFYFTRNFGGIFDITKNWDSVKEYCFEDRKMERHDPDLIKVVEELGCEVASGSFARLEIEKVHYQIRNYDGKETIEL